jgi:rare lipoprotein A
MSSTGGFRFARSRNAAVFCLAIALAAAAAGCGKKTKKIATVPAVRTTPRVGAVEEGVASWYGHPYHGRRAANGEIYDMEKMTAAHRTLPFDTWVSVENLNNGKTCTVRIIDRGPFIDGRIIDLSHAAAREIELIGPGVAKVRLKIVAAPPPTEPVVNLFAVQVGAFQDRMRAERVREDFERRYGTARIVLRAGNPELWRVLVGAEPTEAGANELAGRIRTEEKTALVVRLDNPAEGPALDD